MFNCEECGLIYATRRSLRQHKNVTHGHPCNICDDIFPNRTSLKKHWINHRENLVEIMRGVGSKQMNSRIDKGRMATRKSYNRPEPKKTAPSIIKLPTQRSAKCKPYNQTKLMIVNLNDEKPSNQAVCMEPRPVCLKRDTYEILYQEPILPKTDNICAFKTDKQLILTRRTKDKALFLHLRKCVDKRIANNEGIILPLELIKKFDETFNEYKSEREENDDMLDALPMDGMCDSKVFGYLTLVCNTSDIWFMMNDKTDVLPRYSPCLRLNYEEWNGFLECIKRIWNLGLVHDRTLKMEICGSYEFD